MANFGVTDQGFRRKRLSDIQTSQRERALSIFADLVPPGEVVDVSSSSLLGRLITLDSAGDADLWELAQQVYLAFDPNSATGISLDNLVALSGITREEATHSTVTVLLKGNPDVVIPADSEVSGSSANSRFVIPSPVELSTERVSGVDIGVLDVLPEANYTITYFTSVGIQTIQYTSSEDPTREDILIGLRNVIQSIHPTLIANIVGDTLSVQRQDPLQVVNFEVGNNMAIVKVLKPTTVIAVEPGPIVAEIGSVNSIATPVMGWDSVINPSNAIVGRNRETDEQLRIRFRDSKFTRATNIVESLYSALYSVEGVEEVRVYENDTDVTDENGVPGHSFMPVVSGGSSEEIAAAIWKNKPLGILSFGNTSVVVSDSQGFAHEVSFERPNPVVVYITINITTDDSFPSNGEDAIRASLIDYFIENFGIGDDIIYSRLYTPINRVPGHQVDSMYIGRDPSPDSQSNLQIGFNEIANLSSVNIVINS